jgi:hypothetical protein
LKEYVVVITHHVMATSPMDATSRAIAREDPDATISVWEVPDSLDEEGSALWRKKLSDVDKLREEGKEQ